MCSKQQLLGVVQSENQSQLRSDVHFLERFYGSCAYYYIFDNRPFSFVAGKQLFEFQCLKFYASGTLLWVGQMEHFVPLMCDLPIGVLAFLV